MSNLEHINHLDVRINSLRFELMSIIAQINETIGTDRKSIRSDEYRQLKQNYFDKKGQIGLLSLQKQRILSHFSYLRRG